MTIALSIARWVVAALVVRLASAAQAVAIRTERLPEGAYASAATTTASSVGTG